MQKVVFLNGPARSGKDMIANYLQANFYIPNTKMSKPLKDTVHCSIGAGGVEHDHFEDEKDNRIKEFFGATPREAYIQCAEEYFKPAFGQEVFGHLWVRQHSYQQKTVCISDVGFDYEINPIMKSIGYENCALIKIARELHTFDGDSRNYIEPPCGKRGPLIFTKSIYNRENDAIATCEKVVEFLRGIKFIA